MFDVDWVAGMPVGVFTIQNADVKGLMQDLDKAIGDRATSPLAGILRIIPIERMNAILVITPQPAYLDEVKKWIDRLDQPGYGEGPRFFVHHLQNQRAEKLAPLLQQAFTGRAQQQVAPAPPTLAPGTPAGTIVSPPTFQPQPAGDHAAGGDSGPAFRRSHCRGHDWHRCRNCRARCGFRRRGRTLVRFAFCKTEEMLQMAVGSPTIEVHTVAYTTEGIPIEYGISRYRSDRYQYIVTLRRRS